MHDIERFIGGFQRFQQHYYNTQPNLFTQLRNKQQPNTLLIGCCDSRVDPALLLGCCPGEIFTVRNVANLVPPLGAGDAHQGVLAAIQFAVDWRIRRGLTHFYRWSARWSLRQCLKSSLRTVYLSS